MISLLQGTDTETSTSIYITSLVIDYAFFIFPKHYQLIIDLHVFCIFCFSIAIEALRAFLTHTESEVMLKFLDQNNAWSLMEAEDTSAHGCLHLARAVTAEYPSFIQSITEALGASLSSIYDPQRITVVAFYSEVCSRVTISCTLVCFWN